MFECVRLERFVYMIICMRYTCILYTEWHPIAVFKFDLALTDYACCVFVVVLAVNANQNRNTNTEIDREKESKKHSFEIHTAHSHTLTQCVRAPLQREFRANKCIDERLSVAIRNDEMTFALKFSTSQHVEEINLYCSSHFLPVQHTIVTFLRHSRISIIHSILIVHLACEISFFYFVHFKFIRSR